MGIYQSDILKLHFIYSYKTTFEVFLYLLEVKLGHLT